jgi:unsaturated rhamnogalacturonyl hydrolase
VPTTSRWSRRSFIAAAGASVALPVLGPLGRVGAALPPILPPRRDIERTLRLVNDHWMHGHSSPGGNDWARATYFTGAMALHRLVGDPRLLRYAEAWAEQNGYGLQGGSATRHADNQCAGQVYYDLYALAPDPAKIQAIEASVGAMVHGPGASVTNDWWWVDALHMALPVFIRAGRRLGDPAHLTSAHVRYQHTKITRKLYAPDLGLWYRDPGFVPPAAASRSPGGLPVVWSRGNGWAVAAQAKAIEALGSQRTAWPEYATDLRATARALVGRQRPDGFWNVNLTDPAHFGGPETSGTAMFTFGLAHGVRTGILDRSTYLPVAARAWNGMVAGAVHPDGLLGHVQGVGLSPASSQPVTATSTADFGVGAFLLAGCELARLAVGDRGASVQTAAERRRRSFEEARRRWASGNSDRQRR